MSVAQAKKAHEKPLCTRDLMRSLSIWVIDLLADPGISYPPFWHTAQYKCAYLALGQGPGLMPGLSILGMP